jgi:hypothetical protein
MFYILRSVCKVKKFASFAELFPTLLQCIKIMGIAHRAIDLCACSPRRRRHFAAAASHILSSHSQPFSRRRRRQSYLRHGGHAIFFGKLQFSRTEATKCHFYNAITVV